MKRKLILIFTLFISISVFGQKKIIFTKGLKRTKIKVGKTVGVTSKGEAFYLESWKSVCSACSDTTYRQRIWTLDSIRKGYIILRQLIDNDTAFVFDTLTYQDHKKIRKYAKEWYWVGEIKSPDSVLVHGKLVYKYPIAFIRKKIIVDSIQSISFSKSDDCIGYDIGLPLMAAILVIGSPIGAIDKGKFDVVVFAVGETLGLLLVYSMYADYQNKLVKTYQVDKWKIKIK